MSDVKPDWSKAPEWANYWAADADGEAFWYDTRPSLEDTIWVDDGLHRSFAGYFGGSFDYRMVHRKPVSVNVEVTLTKPVEEVSIDYKLPENIFGYTAEGFSSDPSKPEKSSAASILEAGLGHMKDRAATYDAEGGERSMAKTVECFNALTGRDLTETEGWLMMVCLKLARANQGGFRMDSFEDGAAYIALMGESAALQQED